MGDVIFSALLKATLHFLACTCVFKHLPFSGCFAASCEQSLPKILGIVRAQTGMNWDAKADRFLYRGTSKSRVSEGAAWRIVLFSSEGRLPPACVKKQAGCSSCVGPREAAARQNTPILGRPRLHRPSVQHSLPEAVPTGGVVRSEGWQPKCWKPLWSVPPGMACPQQGQGCASPLMLCLLAVRQLHCSSLGTSTLTNPNGCVCRGRPSYQGPSEVPIPFPGLKPTLPNLHSTGWSPQVRLLGDKAAEISRQCQCTACYIRAFCLVSGLHMCQSFALEKWWLPSQHLHAWRNSVSFCTEGASRTN